ncbi:MAG: hypothetical protein WCH96_05710, partial [Betaproteobacteria bacterium]
MLGLWSLGDGGRGDVFEDILGLNPLSNILSTSCPAPGGGGSGGGITAKVHPLESTSLCSNITTASFYSKRLQWALQ